MSSIMVLHTALGRRPGVLAFADRLRDRGHDVVVPDYYEAHVFDDVASGLGYRDEVGQRTLLRRLSAALSDLPEDAALAGLSLGAAFAGHIALRRPAARAVVLLHYAAAPARAWSGCPTQVHRHESDPFIDPQEVVRLGEAVTSSGATFEDWVTPGEGHVFIDPDLPGFDEQATQLTVERIDAFLRT